MKNRKIAQEVGKAAHLVEIAGMNLSTALSKSGSFPEMLLQLIEVGSESGQITACLDRIWHQYEKETDARLKRIKRLNGAIMIVVVGIPAGTVVISILLPMFEVAEVF